MYCGVYNTDKCLTKVDLRTLTSNSKKSDLLVDSQQPFTNKVVSFLLKLLSEICSSAVDKHCGWDLFQLIFVIAWWQRQCLLWLRNEILRFQKIIFWMCACLKIWALTSNKAISSFFDARATIVQEQKKMSPRWSWGWDWSLRKNNWKLLTGGKWRMKHKWRGKQAEN